MVVALADWSCFSLFGEAWALSLFRALPLSRFLSLLGEEGGAERIRELRGGAHLRQFWME